MTCWRRSASPEIGPACRIEQHLQTNVFRFRRRTRRIGRRRDHARQINRPHVEPKFSGNNARNVENVVYELRLRAGVAFDGRECFGFFGFT